MPKRKDVPKNLTFEVQRDLLLNPERNPTGYVPFEGADAHPFAPAADSWSRVNAWWLADASWITYSHDADAVREVFCERAGLKACELIARGDRLDERHPFLLRRRSL